MSTADSRVGRPTLVPSLGVAMLCFENSELTYTRLQSIYDLIFSACRKSSVIDRSSAVAITSIAFSVGFAHQVSTRLK